MKRVQSEADDGTGKLLAVIDATFGNAEKDFHSTSGYFAYYNTNLIKANSSTQRQVATSAPEAELYELLRTTKMLLYLRGIFKDFGEKDVDLAILTDSSSTVGTVNNPSSSRYKYLSVYLQFIKQTVDKEDLKVVHLNRKWNFADLLTKQADVETFQRLLQLAMSPFAWIHKKGHGVRK